MELYRKEEEEEVQFPIRGEEKKGGPAQVVRDRRNYEMEAATDNAKPAASALAPPLNQAPPSGNAVSAFPSSTAANGLSSSQVDVAYWNLCDETSEEEEDERRNRSALLGLDCMSEDFDMSGSLSNRAISKDFASNTEEATEDMRWHEVQAVPVLDPVSGLEVR